MGRLPVRTGPKCWAGERGAAGLARLARKMGPETSLPSPVATRCSRCIWPARPPCRASCCDLPDPVRWSASVESNSCPAAQLRCQPSSLPVSFISCASVMTLMVVLRSGVVIRWDGKAVRANAACRRRQGQGTHAIEQIRKDGPAPLRTASRPRPF